MNEKGHRLNENKNQGRWGELYGDDQLIIDGYEIEETGIGSDRHIVKRDVWGNIIDERLIDHKTGNAELTDKQRECGAEKNKVWVPPFTRKFKPPF
jgi:hypothetical protein